jgi:hypothetical protein
VGFCGTTNNAVLRVAIEVASHSEQARLIVSLVASLLHSLRFLVRSRAALRLEIVALRHQLVIASRSRRPRLRLTALDRVLWAWKSRHRTGRPSLPNDVRALIREMSTANPLWGAPRIHGELLKLGILVSESTVAKYLRRYPRPQSQTWRTFLTNHASQSWPPTSSSYRRSPSGCSSSSSSSLTTADRSSTLRSTRIRQRPGRHNNFATRVQRTRRPCIYSTIAIRSLSTWQLPSPEYTFRRFAPDRARRGRRTTLHTAPHWLDPGGRRAVGDRKADDPAS